MTIEPPPETHPIGVTIKFYIQEKTIYIKQQSCYWNLSLTLLPLAQMD